MSNNGPLNGSIKRCPHCDLGLCLVAVNKGREFPCTGGQFHGCTVFLRLKNGGVV